MSDQTNSKRGFAVVVVLLLIVGTIVFFKRKEQIHTPVVPLAKEKEAPRAGRPVVAPLASLPPFGAEPSSEIGTPQPPPIRLGHENHGPECASCLAEKRLAEFQEDFARMEFDHLAVRFELDSEQSALLREKCRLFAVAVLTEWSHAESRPVMPPDETVAGHRRQIIEPLLARFSERDSD